MGSERILADADSLLDVAGTDILRDVDWFCAALEEHRITPRPRSVLRDGLDAIRSIGQAQMAQTAEAAQTAELEPTPEQLRRGMGVYFLIGAVKQLHDRAPAALDQVWQLFRGADVLLTAGSKQSRARDTMFEVLVASVVSEVTPLVGLGGSSNPDVPFTYRGLRCGIECKAVYNPDRDAVRTAIRRKAEQIRDNPAIEHGWIALDVTAPFRGHALDDFKVSRQAAHERLRSHLREVSRSALSDSRLRARLVADSPKLQGIVWFANAACLAVDRMTFLHVAHWVHTDPARSHQELIAAPP